jgi:predicted DNA-binding transcriptional regulator AlpA
MVGNRHPKTPQNLWGLFPVALSQNGLKMVTNHSTRPIDRKITDSQLVFLADRDVAKLLGISLSTIRRWRLLRRGPPFHKLGSSVRYQLGSVIAWLEQQPSGGEHAEAE